MSEILNILISHSLELVLLWVFVLIVFMIILRKLYWSIIDPLVIGLALIVAPGTAGMLCIAFYLEYYPGVDLKILAFFTCFFAFIHGLKKSYGRNNALAHEFYIDAGYMWQLIILITSTVVISSNLLVNGNFDSSEPSSRFANVSIPSLNYLSIALTSYTAFFFAFTRITSVRIGAAICLILIATIQINAGASKSFFISWLMIYLYWNFSRNKLNISIILIHLKRLSFTYSGLKFVIISMFLAASATVYLFASNLSDAFSLFIRFVLPFDSPAIFITSEEIKLNTPQNVTGFYTILDVWMKPFLKNLFSIQFDYENISQYLAYEMTGYRANDYSETSWQPNNNILIDFLIIHGWLGLLMSYLLGRLLGASLRNLKSQNKITTLNMPFFILLVVTPFYIFTDAQSFFTSAILCCFFIYLINFSLFIIKHAKS